MKHPLLILLTISSFLFSVSSTAALISATATELTTPTVNSNFSTTAASVNAELLEFGFDRRAQARATQSGELEVHSSNDGGQQYSSTASWQQTVTNTTAAAAAYQLDFSTGTGRVSFSSHAEPSTGSLFGATGTSGYTIEVLLNGSAIWQSAAEISESEGILMGSGINLSRSVYSFSQSGVDLAGTLDLQDWELGDTFVPSSYTFGSTNFNLELGGLLAGESLTVTYILHSYANQANLGQTRIGTGSFASISATPVSEVPLPAALPLLFSSLLGFSIFARRKSDKIK